MALNQKKKKSEKEKLVQNLTTVPVLSKFENFKITDWYQSQTKINSAIFFTHLPLFKDAIKHVLLDTI